MHIIMTSTPSCDKANEWFSKVEVKNIELQIKIDIKASLSSIFFFGYFILSHQQAFKNSQT